MQKLLYLHVLHQNWDDLKTKTIDQTLTGDLPKWPSYCKEWQLHDSKTSHRVTQDFQCVAQRKPG